MNKSESNKDSMVKNLGAILLGIIVLALIYNVFFSPQQNYGGYGFDMRMGNWGMQTGYGMGGSGFDLNLGSILGGILIILVKLLSITLVVGLAVGLWVMIKDYLFSDSDNPLSSLTKAFSKNKMSCPKCGSSVDTTWDFCPDCGQAITKKNKTQQNNTGGQTNEA